MAKKDIKIGDKQNLIISFDHDRSTYQFMYNTDSTFKRIDQYLKKEMKNKITKEVIKYKDLTLVIIGDNNPYLYPKHIENLYDEYPHYALKEWVFTDDADIKYVDRDETIEQLKSTVAELQSVIASMVDYFNPSKTGLVTPQELKSKEAIWKNIVRVMKKIPSLQSTTEVIDPIPYNNTIHNIVKPTIVETIYQPVPTQTNILPINQPSTVIERLW